MLFVTLLNAKPTFTFEKSMQRRAEWKQPEGVKPVAEYWLMTPSPMVISIEEADSIAPLMAAVGGWSDLFDMTIIPAVSAEEGLKLASQMMPKT